MSNKFTPAAYTVTYQVIEFFKANPEETLDREAVSIKFGCTEHSVHTILGPAVQAGVLLRKENLADGELVYSLGDLSKLGTKRKPKQPFLLDKSSVQIEKDVPLPTVFRRGKSDFADIFRAMAVGDSFELPVAGRCSVSSAVTAFKKANPGVNLATRTIGDKLRVWRLA